MSKGDEAEQQTLIDRILSRLGPVESEERPTRSTQRPGPVRPAHAAKADEPAEDEEEVELAAPVISKATHESVATTESADTTVVVGPDESISTDESENAHQSDVRDEPGPDQSADDVEPLFDEPDEIFDDVAPRTWLEPERASQQVVTRSTSQPPTDLGDPDDWVRMPRRIGSAARFLIVSSCFLVVGLVIYSSANGWYQDVVDPPGEPGDVIEFEIASGATTNNVAQDLYSKDVVAQPTIFRIWLGDNFDGEFQAGQYECIRTNMSFDEVLECLVDDGPVPARTFSITVPEGLRLTEILDRLVEENPSFDRDVLEQELGRELVSVDLSGVPTEPIEGNPDPTGSGKEGLLFPATYDIEESGISNEIGILTRMAQEMENRFEGAVEAVGRDPVIDELELTDYQVLIVASLIEEEYGTETDLRRISRVLYNRLLQGESLGIDASSCYAAAKPCADLTQSDLDSDSPWNTRNTDNKNLPPTPIASPGDGAIRAALDPEPGEWIFYVRTEENGGHTFAVTNQEFLEAKALCNERGFGCG